MAKKPSPPPAPDYAGAAVAQGAANVDAARVAGRMNNPNIVGPLGGQTVSWNGDQPTVTQTLTPTAQSTLEAQQRVQGALANLGERGASTASGVLGTAFNPTGGPLQTKLDTSGVAAMPVNAGTTGQEAIMARLQPQIERMDALCERRRAIAARYDEAFSALGSVDFPVVPETAWSARHLYTIWVDPDRRDATDGVRAFYRRLHTSAAEFTWGTLSAWAWSGSRAAVGIRSASICLPSTTTTTATARFTTYTT
jgi:hypothetical protein